MAIVAVLADLRSRYCLNGISFCAPLGRVPMSAGPEPPPLVRDHAPGSLGDKRAPKGAAVWGRAMPAWAAAARPVRRGCVGEQRTVCWWSAA